MSRRQDKNPGDIWGQSIESGLFLPSGSDVVGQCGLIAMDAFAVNHIDRAAHGVGDHASVDGRQTQWRRLEHGREPR